MLINVKLLLSYHGSSFKGWQKTRMGPNIEQLLSDALEKILQYPVTLQAASRTDAGVHAEGQVVNFFLKQSIPLPQLVYRLNRVLPPQLSITSAEEMKEDFHPTLQAQGKEYWYHICHGKTQLPFYRKTSWHFPYPLDLKQMEDGASCLVGTHDFSSLCNQQNIPMKNPVCTLKSISLIPIDQERLSIRVVGNRFLFKMMRNLVGTLAYVGCGKLKAQDLPQILLEKNRIFAGITAPAHGLLLKQVFYSQI